MSIKRLFALVLVFGFTCIAWITLGGITHSRTSEQRDVLRGQVASLWGEEHTQTAPRLEFRAVVPATREIAESVVISEPEASLLALRFAPRKELVPPKPLEKMSPEERKEWDDQLQRERALWVVRSAATPVALSGSTLDVQLKSDPRRKGLVWYSLYDVHFKSEFVYRHRASDAGYLDLDLALPTSDAIYDGLIFELNGRDHRANLDPAAGRFRVTLPIQPGEELRFRLEYKSRGSSTWRYEPGEGIQQLENFKMNLATDFEDIDFPSQTLSPSRKQRVGEGWLLGWDFASTVTGHGMGMVMPQHIQPGELSSDLSFSAPISLMFFFILLFVVAALRDLEIHPINYLFLAAAFFSFHLLFSYMVDHITVAWAFLVSSMVSLMLVISYLRLVVSARFAFREAALGQLVYLVGFSLAHFWEGYTGLTVSVLATVTLFLLMQATGRLRWADVLSSSPKVAAAKSGAQEGIGHTS